MAFFSKRLMALTAFLAVLIAGTCIYFTNSNEPTAAAEQAAVSRTVAVKPMPVRDDTEYVAAAQKQRDEDAWWAWAAVQEWNKAVARNEALRQAEEAKRQTPRLREVQRAASGGGSYHGNPAGSVNGYPCGGDLPPCYVLQRESRGNPGAENPVSSASGLWQFIDGTWNGFGGYSHASDAPPDVQNEKARQTWAGGAGAGHWACC